jgi:hypothetical protein
MVPRVVSNRVNAVRNDDAQNLSPFDPSTTPPQPPRKSGDPRQGDLF